MLLKVKITKKNMDKIVTHKVTFEISQNSSFWHQIKM